MKLVIQRVSHALVEVEGKRVGMIGAGALIFVGITHTDTSAEVSWLANKCTHLRMFEDHQGKMNKSLLESQGQVLIVSQFTLYADCAEGRRPSFTQAAAPEKARELYELFVAEMQKSGLKVKTGIFGAEMRVSLLNHGPVTFILEK